MRIRRSLQFLAGIGFLAFGLSQQASAAIFNIANGDVAGLITAINAANTNGQPDLINLWPGGTYTLTAVDNNTDGQNGLPSLVNDASGADLTVNGNGATIQRSTAGGTPLFRIFHVQVGSDVTISRLTITGGSSSATSVTVVHSQGGGIYTHGALTLASCTLSGNSALGQGAGARGNGGGIYIAEGSVTLTNEDYILDTR